jgi:ribose 5-phosphate isomerase A
LADEGAKAAAAAHALELVEPGMLLGIGTGSTSRYFIEGLRGKDVIVVPTSEASASHARAVGLTVTYAPPHELDLAIDGADEIDPELRLIKGRGGALFREKLVALFAHKFIAIADDSKLVDRLGAGVLPVEVLPFLWMQTAHRLESLDCAWRLRGGQESPFVSDNGNWVLDLAFPAGIQDPESLALAIKETPGVCEHGLFIGIARAAIVAGQHGVRVLGEL